MRFILIDELEVFFCWKFKNYLISNHICIHRLPHDWNILTTYLLTVSLQSLFNSLETTMLLIVLCFYNGFCLFSMSLCPEIEMKSRQLNEYIVLKSGRFPAAKRYSRRFWNIAQLHGNAIKLSILRINFHSMTNPHL